MQKNQGLTDQHPCLFRLLRQLTSGHSLPVTRLQCARPSARLLLRPATLLTAAPWCAYRHCARSARRRVKFRELKPPARGLRPAVAELESTPWPPGPRAQAPDDAAVLVGTQSVLTRHPGSKRGRAGEAVPAPPHLQSSPVLADEPQAASTLAQRWLHGCRQGSRNHGDTSPCTSGRP